MSRLELSVACGLNDRTMALLARWIDVQGLDLNCMAIDPVELFDRQLRLNQFDVAECSLSAYISLIDRGDDRFVGLPVFTSRVFRHSYVFTNSDRGIDDPGQLRGGTIGVPEYHMTAALFIRGLLSDDYGVTAPGVSWVQGGQAKPGRKERIELQLPPSIRVQHVVDRTLDDMLVSGELDALITATAPPSFRAGDPRVRRLFADPESASTDWFSRTEIFPIMHLMTVRRELVERHPWIIQSLYDAFSRSRDMAVDRLRADGVAAVALPFVDLQYERALAMFPQGLWPYGVEPNRRTLEAAARYSHEQGLARRVVSLAELFPVEVREAAWHD